MTETAKAKVAEWLSYAIDKGLVNANTGRGWQVAFAKILEDFNAEDDLSGVDVPSEVLRFNNRHPGLLSPDSLHQYQKRVIAVLAEYTKYRNSPTTYKGVLRGPVAAKSDGGSKASKKPPLKQLPAPEVVSPPSSPEHSQHKLSAATESSLMMPFPLRPNFLVQIIVPRDMTKDEAARLCTFITALGHDNPVVN